MPISAGSSLNVGLDALRANPLRTILSTLGVVMGVGAMVSVLSMGDGVEKFARDQIAETTDLLGISVAPVTSTTVDGLSLRRDDIIRFRSADARALREAVEGEEKVVLVTTGVALVVLDSTAAPRGFTVLGTLEAHAEDVGLELLAGRWYRDADTAVIVLNRRAAGVVAGDTAAPERALGRTIRLQGNPHEVIGIAVAGEGAGRGSGGDGLTGFVPVDAAEQAISGARVPALIVSARLIEEVDSVRARTERWAAATYGPNWKERLAISTNQARVAQVAAGMLVFKLLMGSITGVSLLVGGIGIMNVLLAAVAERTREIGIRKATGARDRDILVQFLAESVAITSAGAAVGVALGLGIAFVTAAIMRTQTSAPVRAAVTPGTIAVAAGAAVFIGIVFGLYPALRASRLSPIDAIRHE